MSSRFRYTEFTPTGDNEGGSIGVEGFENISGQISDNMGLDVEVNLKDAVQLVYNVASSGRFYTHNQNIQDITGLYYDTHGRVIDRPVPGDAAETSDRSMNILAIGLAEDEAAITATYIPDQTTMQDLAETGGFTIETVDGKSYLRYGDFWLVKGVNDSNKREIVANEKVTSELYILSKYVYNQVETVYHFNIICSFHDNEADEYGEYIPNPPSFSMEFSSENTDFTVQLCGEDGDTIETKLKEFFKDKFVSLSRSENVLSLVISNGVVFTTEITNDIVLTTDEPTASIDFTLDIKNSKFEDENKWDYVAATTYKVEYIDQKSGDNKDALLSLTFSTPLDPSDPESAIQRILDKTQNDEYMSEDYQITESCVENTSSIIYLDYLFPNEEEGKKQDQKDVLIFQIDKNDIEQTFEIDNTAKKIIFKRIGAGENNIGFNDIISPNNAIPTFISRQQKVLSFIKNIPSGTKTQISSLPVKKDWTWFDFIGYYSIRSGSGIPASTSIKQVQIDKNDNDKIFGGNIDVVNLIYLTADDSLMAGGGKMYFISPDSVYDGIKYEKPYLPPIVSEDSWWTDKIIEI